MTDSWRECVHVGTQSLARGGVRDAGRRWARVGHPDRPVCVWPGGEPIRLTFAVTNASGKACELAKVAEGTDSLLPGRVGASVAAQVHHVVENPADDDHLAVDPIHDEVAGSAYGARPGAIIAAAAQVPGTYTFTEFGALGAAGAGRVRGDVTDGCGDEPLVALACLRAKLVLGPGEDVDDVGPGRV